VHVIYDIFSSNSKFPFLCDASDRLALLIYGLKLAAAGYPLQ